MNDRDELKDQSSQREGQPKMTEESYADQGEESPRSLETTSVRNRVNLHSKATSGESYPRFSNESFLLSRGWFLFERLMESLRRHLTGSAAQVFVFGGGLGLIWVLSHLEPQSDLSLYLIPISILAMPAAVISPNDGWSDRLINALFIAPFVGFYLWGFIWYFQYPEWNYDARWLIIEGGLVSMLTYFCFKRSFRLPEGPQRTLLRRLWFLGVGVSIGALAFLGYYLAYQTSPEPGTSNLLAGGSFVIFLAILIIRVFWLDSIRARRANRAEFTPPPDHIILFEWLVPRSFNFTVTLGMLLIAQSMMFSTIYRAYQAQDEQRHRQAQQPSEDQGNNTSLLQSVAPVQSLPQEERSVQLKVPRPTVALSSWVFFSFKPYVFPKDNLGREVPAPRWFKYLGRALIGLVIAILLTKQLNIWKQIMGYYWILLGARRLEAHRGKSPELSRQQNEMIENLTGIFNHYSFFWRWMLFYAVTAPTLSLRWRLILDPATAYYMGLERAHDWVIARWDVAIAFAAGFILLVTSPFAYLTPDSFEALLHASLPSVGCALIIFFFRVIVGLKPPSSYQSWIWWVLICHVVISILNYFLSLNLGTHEAFWPRLLWYSELATIVVYPAVYLLGGDRYRRVSHPARRKNIQDHDCDVSTRRDLLIAFCRTEHRQWMISRLTTKVHPVRSSTLQLRLITPSLLLNLVEGLRSMTALLRELLSPFIRSVPMSVSAWLGLMMISWSGTLISHLFIHHQALPLKLVLTYLLDLGLLIAPLMSTLLFYMIGRRGNLHMRPVTWRVSMLACQVIIALGVLWVWSFLSDHTIFDWVDHSQVRPYDAWLVVWVVPLLPIWRMWLTPKLKRDDQESNTHQTEDEVSTSSPTKIEQALQKIEEQLVSSVYQRAIRGRKFEVRFQDTMVLCVANVVENSFERLKQGQWFLEERHAFTRVVSEIMSKTQPHADLYTEVIEELALLLETSLDTLGSLLHDLTMTELLNSEADSGSEEEEAFRLPDLLTVIESLHQIAQFPLLERGQAPRSSTSTALARLKSCHQQVIALVNSLVVLTHPNRKDAWNSQESLSEGSSVKRMIGFEERSALLQLWCSLESRSEQVHEYDGQLSPALQAIFDEFSLSNSWLNTHPLIVKELLSSVLSHPLGDYLINQLLLEEKSEDDPLKQVYTDFLALSILPTPIALTYQQLLEAMEDVERSEREWTARHDERVERERVTGELRVSTRLLNQVDFFRQPKGVLKRLQSPIQVQLIEGELEAQRILDRAKRRRYEALHGFYFGSFAYLVCALKDRQTGVGALNQTSWQSAEGVGELLSAIECIEPSHDTSALIEILLSRFKLQDAQFVEQSCRDRSAWREVHAICSRLLENLLDEFTEGRLPFYVLSSAATQTVEDTLSSQSILRLKGLRPYFAMEDKLQEDQRIKPRFDDLQLGSGLRLTDLDQSVDIDYYTALWLLNLLYSLVHSDEVLQVSDPKEINDKIEYLRATLHRIGKLLKPFAGEEQDVIERVFDLTFRRLGVLRSMGAESLEALEGKGAIEFQYTLRRVVAYLDNLEQRRHGEMNVLSLIGLPPELHFSYLLHIEYTDQGELRTYLSETGMPEVLLTE